MVNDVFISYSTKDKIIADAVCNNLEKKGIRCWIAPRDVISNKKPDESIFEAINKAKVLVLILSSNSNHSSSVTSELEIAADSETIIIPFRVEEVIPSKKLSFFISSSQWLDALTPPLEAHIDSLTHVISKFLSDEDISDKDTRYPGKSLKSNNLSNKVIFEQHRSSLYNKIRVYELNPIITVIAGIITFNFFNFLYNNNFGGSILVFIGLMMGGFFATYFSKGKKIQYGIYMGVGSVITTSILQFLFKMNEYKLNINAILIFLTICILFAIIGSFIGKKTSKHILKRQEKNFIG